MRLKISGLNELRERLERLRPEEVMARALAEQAERMAARVRDGLSEQPGAAGHDQPWLQSGALRDSVGAQADGLQAVVGSSDPAAVPQEMGTARMPARPFLAPVAADMGEDVARAVGAAMAAALRGDNPDADSVNRSNTDGFDPSGVRLISESGKHPEDLGDVPPDVVAATRMPNGNIAFLERGNSKSGLQHIAERHGAEFAQAGIPEGKIPDFLTQALKNGKVVGQQSRRGRRPIYEVSYEGRTLHVAITVGSNGYIVGANMR